MTTETLTITDFLLARIAEDEERARGAQRDAAWAGGKGASWLVEATPDGSEILTPSRDGRHAIVVYAEAGTPAAGVANHIAHHDPARVLAECEAKRRIVELHDQELKVALRNRDASAFGGEVMHDLVLCALASVYADHPDYRDEWRP